MPWKEVFCLLLASPILTSLALALVQGKLVKRLHIFVVLEEEDNPAMAVAGPVILANWHPQYYYANASRKGKKLSCCESILKVIFSIFHRHTSFHAEGRKEY